VRPKKTQGKRRKEVKGTEKLSWIVEMALQTMLIGSRRRESPFVNLTVVVDP